MGEIPSTPAEDALNAAMQARDRTRSLEGRVAALERAISPPAVPVNFPAMSDEDAERFRKEFEARASQPLRVLPHPAPLTADQIRQFLLDHVTVVKPGETLIIRAWADMTPRQIQEVSEWLNFVRDDGTPLLPFRTVVVPGEALGIVSDEVVQESLRSLVRDEMEAALIRADRAAVTDDDLDEQ